MKRQIACFLTILALAAPLLSVAAGAETSASGEQQTLLFSDVPADAWYAPYVQVCIEEGLLTGTGDGLFQPQRNLTMVECFLLAVRLHRVVNGLSSSLPQAPEGWGAMAVTDESGTVLFTVQDRTGYTNSGDSFLLGLPPEKVAPLEGQTGRLILHGETYTGVFEVSEDDAGIRLSLDKKQNGGDIIDGIYLAAELKNAPSWAIDGSYYAWSEGLQLSYLDTGSYPANRLAFLASIEEVADPASLPELNQVDALPDIPVDSYSGYSSGGEDPYTYTTGNFAAFYRAGILSGVDEYGTFHAGGLLTRAEAAAIAARILCPELRMTFTLTPTVWETEYTLTPLGISTEDWWHNSDVDWIFPDLMQNPLDTQLLRVSRRENGQVNSDQDGILTMDGTWLVEPGRYGEIGSFGPDDLALVASTHYLGTAKFGAIDAAGREIVSPVYDHIASLHDGILTAWNNGDETYTLIDAQGQVCGSLPGWADGTRGVRESMALYQDETGKWGYLDLEGHVIIPARFDKAQHFYEGLAAVVLDGKAGFIDQTGETVIPFQFDPWGYGYQFRDGIAIVSKDGSYMIVDRSGAQVPPDYSGIPNYVDRQIMAACGPFYSYYLIWWTPGGAFNYMDREGELLLPVWFSSASPLTEDGRAIVLGKDGMYCRLELKNLP